MNNRFLIVSPHPDDAELGIGGTIIKLTESGHKVYIVDLTSGEPTPYGNLKKRKEEAARAGRILKITARINLGWENRYLFDSKSSRSLLAEQIRILRPDVLLCPSLKDAHPDHLAAAKISTAARFYAKYTRTNLMGKPHYPRHIFYYSSVHFRCLPEISFLLDISAQFARKMQALRCYRSQFIDNPKNRKMLEYLKIQNNYFGKLIRTRYAEALYSPEALKVNDLTALL